MKTLRKTWILFVLFAVLLASCQLLPDVEGPGSEAPGETGYSYGEDALVESVSVVILESFPVQVQATVSGSLPDGCTELDEISVEQQDQIFILTLVTRVPEGDLACTEALVPFEETVILDVSGLSAGTYTVVAQDQSAEFTLEVDNELPPTASIGDTINQTSRAVVEGLFVTLDETQPKVSVTVQGYLPDGCTSIEEMTIDRQGQIFLLKILTNDVDPNVSCTMAIVPFDETIELDVAGLAPGEYTVSCGEFEDSFTIDGDSPAEPEDQTCPTPQEGESLMQYANRALAYGFCFLVPEGFERQTGEAQPAFKVIGPDYEGEGMLANQAVLSIEIEPRAGLTLEESVAQKNEEIAAGAELWQEDLTLDGIPAILVEGYPAQIGVRVVWAAFGDQIFRLTFSPLSPDDQPEATGDMDLLFEKVTDTWVFLGGQ